ncbi:Gfo/Idh/MocA family oxidoreductase [Subtercola sp. RTI3]|uniref:Gfo/Idh/MocA family protein n=1 Tax=Subtercola sp. RTI3 TaxID=3048639 RepID=UPI002B23BB86|nr:Gfo/Idh/MocA family oxidoreductase [Subtercola sp. RTI3]MEA9985004.1 Gfo/Idh/MocA family oxidoreductase [Subtercola sp. RTI3]
MTTVSGARSPHLLTEPIRTAVIGFGLSGRVFHSPFVAADPRFELSAIVTGNAERVAEAGVLHPSARVLRNTDELFDHADEYDLVVIGSPPVTHYPLALTALEAGLAVVVDKPFAANSSQGAHLVARAAELGQALTVFQNRRWDADYLTLAKLLGAGELGDVYRFESRFEWWRPQGGKAWKNEATVSEGGGILFDLGTHLIDQALQLFGPIDEVYSEVRTRRAGGSADDDAFVALRHTSGVQSQLWMNGLAAQKGARFHVLGSRSAFTKWGLDGQEAALKGGMLPSDAAYGIEPESAWAEVGVDGDTRRVPLERGDYSAFYSQLGDALTTGSALPVDAADSQEVLEIIEQLHAGRA